MDEKEYSLDDAYFSLDDKGFSKWVSAENDIMKKSVIDEGFHSLKQLPSTYKNRRRKKKVVEKELPEEVERDLSALKMRDVFDAKRFYKRSAFKGIKDNIQVGVVLDSPADFYNSRLPTKMRKNTLVDELLADAKFKKDIKRRYVNIIEQNKHKYKRKHKFIKMKNKDKNKKQSKNKT